MSANGNGAAASYDRIARARTGDMKSKDTPFRHFNNYVKKSLVQFALDSAKSHCTLTSSSAPGGADSVAVVDLASGRGGDLGKWLFMQSPASAEAPSATAARQSPAPRWGGRAAAPDVSWRDGLFGSRVAAPAGAGAEGATPPRRDGVVRMTHYEGYDISPECVAEAQRRYVAMAKGSTCHAQFSVADCFSDKFLCCLRTRAEQVHVVSIQFALHYACRDSDTVRKVAEAVAACLVPGGVVIITTVDPVELSHRVREKRFGNSMYSIELLSPEPLWEAESGGAEDRSILAAGTGYHFKLKGFVDCVEYVVPVHLLREWMAAAGMEECEAVSKPFAHYLHDYGRDWSKNRGNILSRAEEELATLYTCLVFRKRQLKRL